jgi:hypothetical protein
MKSNIVLALMLVGTVAIAKDLTFPIIQSNCGSFGNVITAVQQMRNADVPIDKAKQMLKDASDACVKENGKEQCILQDKEGQDMLDAMMAMIWKNPPIDADSFGMDVYTHCLEASKGKML